MARQTVKEKVIPSRWLEQEDRRLDCGPYVSGAIEAKELLQRLPVAQAKLREVTCGHDGGIYNGPKFVRNYVFDPTYGVPFLSSSSMLHSDFRNVDLLRKSDAVSGRLAFLQLKEGMTLISCSGTIGRMTYARRELAGMWSSQHILKVAPDPQVALPGYLYAFLSSRFGIPLVTGSTYGAIVQHIEPKHISDLPVPLAPGEIQGEAHRLVEKAAELRTEASAELRSVIQEIEEAAGLPALTVRYNAPRPDTSSVNASALGGRMDGLFHSNYHQSALEPLRRLSVSRRATIGEFAARMLWPPPFKRIRAEDTRYGVPFFGTSALMRADPDASFVLSRRTLGFDNLVVNKLTVLIPASGQLNGIIGHAVLPYGDVVGGAVTSDAIRLFCPSEAVAGYVFAALSSEYARRQLKAHATGSSIPHLHYPGIDTVMVPRVPEDQMEAIGIRAFAVRTARHVAVAKEREARSLVERWIEEKGVA